MSTYREAIQHARSGGTARHGKREIRFLTSAEAAPILLEQRPSRAVMRNKDGAVIEKNGQIVVETFADPNYRLQKLGLYDVSSGEPVEFVPADEEVFTLDEDGAQILVTDWVREGIDEEPAPEPVAPEPAPEPVAPETVDETLVETSPES